MRPWPHLRVQKYELLAIWPNVFVKKYNKIQWQRLAKDELLLKAQYFTAQEKSERFFRLFQRADCKHTQKHIQHMEKPRDYAGKLLKNIKRVEGWMHMRGNAGGKVYERGNTNKTNKANKGAYYVRVIYII